MGGWVLSLGSIRTGIIISTSHIASIATRIEDFYVKDRLHYIIGLGYHVNAPFYHYYRLERSRSAIAD